MDQTISFRVLKKEDLTFFSEVRNECAKEFLHNPNSFTLEETLEWFQTSNPNYYIIEYDNNKIGYFRLSNHNKEESSIYIGCDIHSDYRGKGLAYKSYLSFIPFLYKEFSVETINLEVLSTNTRAKNLYEKIGFVYNPEKSNLIDRNDEEVLSEFWSLKKNKICYIISIFFGNRRNTQIPVYYTNRLCLLEKHIQLLNELNHNLDKVIFNINIEDGDYDLVNKALKITPKKIHNTDVEVRLRRNIGMSYGAWSDCYLENKNKYDYFIFNEDDYFFVIDNFDDILVRKFKEKGDAGYLCGIVLENKSLNQPLHAAHSTGISSNEVLSKVVDKYGELPHTKSNIYSVVEINSQITQTQSIIDTGYKLYDLGDEYKIPFDYTNTIKDFFPENNKLIILPWKLVN
jgi:RimJ/RimL family protein N-acetyltransferase